MTIPFHHLAWWRLPSLQGKPDPPPPGEPATAPWSGALLVFALVTAFALGGSARSDTAQLMVLQPLGVLILAAAAALTRWQSIRGNLGLGLLVAGAILLTLVQLVPLPPRLWTALPARDLVGAIDQVLGQRLARPLSVDPAATQASLIGLALPAAVVLLAIAVPAATLRRVVGLILGIGVVSAGLAALQAMSQPDGPLYLYRWTNNGSLVGLFANRNHQAVFLACLAPLAAAMAVPYENSHRASAGVRGMIGWAGGAAGLALVMALVLVTASRAGLAALLLGLAFCPWIVAASARAGQTNRRMLGWGLLGAIGLIILAIALMEQRAVALERLLGTDQTVEMRVKILPVVREMIDTYWPWGSGFGSFSRLYQIHEPDSLLATTYMNQAHNDVLQLLIEGGLPALLLVIGVVAFLAVQCCRRERQAGLDASERALGRSALAVLVILAFASLFDYPLRTPALACLAALAVVLASRTPPSAAVASD